MSSAGAASVIDDRHVTVGGHQLHLRSGGSSGTLPTVVLEAGCGSILPSWSGVEQGLAPHTRVISYERAGVGSSSGSVDSVRAPAVAQRLDALLKTTGTQTPVILAGHSLGGLYSRFFAASRPELVAGLVLLDTTPDDLPFPRGYLLKPWALMWLVHGLARLRVLKPLALRLSPPEIDPEKVLKQTEAWGRFLHVKTVLAEMAALPMIQAEVAAQATAAPAALPVLTISAGKRPPAVTKAQAEAFRHSHEKLAAAGRPPYSRHFRIEGATHMSMLIDPGHAATVAAQILEFARQITPALPA